MPNWVPVSVPDLCPRCGAYWECEEHGTQVVEVSGLQVDDRPRSEFDGFANVEGSGTALTVENMQAAIQRIKAAPDWPRDHLFFQLDGEDAS